MPIPVYGSMSRPADPIEGAAELALNVLPWNYLSSIRITFSTDEFTSVCPTTGQPDFSSIEVVYIPNSFYLESKSIKLWLWSFREHGAHVETLAEILKEDIKRALIDAEYVCVTVTQAARGGIKITAQSEYSSES